MIQSSVYAGSELGYEPDADPRQQLKVAAAESERENKLILLIAGGDWCSWCYILNNYLEKHKDIYQKLKETFVVVKVYYGDENYNEVLFSQLPEANGFPYFWILSSDLRILGTKGTGALRCEHDDYSQSKFDEFITYWQTSLRNL